MKRLRAVVLAIVVFIAVLGGALLFVTPRFEKRNVALPGAWCSGFFRSDDASAPPKFAVIYPVETVAFVTGSDWSMAPVPGGLVVARNGIFLDGDSLVKDQDRIFVVGRNLTVTPLVLSKEEATMFSIDRLDGLPQSELWQRISVLMNTE